MSLFKSEPFEQHSVNWSDLFGLLRKYRLLILAVFFSGTVGAWLVLQVFFTDQYETKVKLLVKIGRENAEVPSTVQNSQVLNTGVRREDINSEVELMSSRVLVEAVVDQFGPDAFKSELRRPDSPWGYPRYYLKRGARLAKAGYQEALIYANLKKRLTPREAAILGVSKGLKVEPVKDSDVLLLKLRLPDRKLAVDVANALLHTYLERRVAVRRSNASKDFFDSQVAQYQQRMAQLMARRAYVRDKWQLAEPQQQRTLLLKQLSDINSDIIRTEAEAEKLRNEQQQIQAGLKKVPDLVRKEQVTTQNPHAQSLKERLTALKVERAKMLGRYLVESDPVKKIDAEIADVRTMLAAETPTIVASVTSETNPVAKTLHVEAEQHDVKVAGLEKQANHLRVPAEDLTEQLAKVNRGNDALESAEREYRIAEQNYLAYLKRSEEARVSEEMDSQRIANVAVISAPEMPIEPVYPRKLFIMAITLPVSLILGLALAGLMESMDDRVTRASDVQTIGELDYLGVFRFEPERELHVNGHTNGHGNGHGNGHAVAAGNGTKGSHNGA